MSELCYLHPSQFQPQGQPGLEGGLELHGLHQEGISGEVVPGLCAAGGQEGGEAVLLPFNNFAELLVVFASEKGGNAGFAGVFVEGSDGFGHLYHSFVTTPNGIV